MEPAMWKAGEEYLKKNGVAPAGGPFSENLAWTRGKGKQGMPGALGKTLQENVKQYMGSI